VNRRTALRLIGAGVAVGAGTAGLPWLAAEGQPGRVLASRLPLPRPYQRPLPVPPTRTGSAIRLTQRVAVVEILPGVQTEIYGYDGTFPGPTVVSRSGQPLTVRHRNELPVPTVTHLHGGHTPPDSDGFPTDLLLPVGGGATGTGHHPDPAAVVRTGERDHTYPLAQRAATLWYHDHAMDRTGPNVWRGLAGFHLVHDDEEDALPLPKGDRDLPLLIADRSFAADGSLLHRAHGDREPGVLGDVITVNGVAWPYHEVAATRHRLRLLNASNARQYRLALDPPGGGLVQVGSDGGLLAAPVRHDSIDIAPAERFDVVVDFGRYSPGQRVDLVNRLGDGGTARVMRFVVGSRAADDSTVPARLSTVEPLPTPKRTRAFRMGSLDGVWTINGAGFDPVRPVAMPALGATEIWRFTADVHHPVHLHLGHFQVVGRGDRGPGPYDAGWKDTVNVRPGETVSVAVRFTASRGRSVIHCHNLEHEDMAMMAMFAVI